MRTHIQRLLLGGLLWSATLTLHAQGGPAPSPTLPPSPPLQLKGSVADVWSAELDREGKQKDKIVLVETQQGQSVIADLGHVKHVTKDAEEGAPAVVTGQMLTVEGNRRFVPTDVKVGKKSASAAAKSAAQQRKRAPGTTADPVQQRIDD